MAYVDNFDVSYRVIVLVYTKKHYCECNLSITQSQLIVVL